MPKKGTRIVAKGRFPHTIVVSCSFRAKPTRDFEQYKPSARTVLVIRAGLSAGCDLDILRHDGYALHVVDVPGFEHEPEPGWEEQEERPRNLATLVDDHIVPALDQLVKDENGPIAVVAASKAGQCALPRLWERYWRGPTVCLHGLCFPSPSEAVQVPLGLIVGGHAGRACMQRFRAWPSRVACAVFPGDPDPQLRMPYRVAIRAVLDMVVSGPEMALRFQTFDATAWTGGELHVKPPPPPEEAKTESFSHAPPRFTPVPLKFKQQPAVVRAGTRVRIVELEGKGAEHNLKIGTVVEERADGRVNVRIDHVKGVKGIRRVNLKRVFHEYEYTRMFATGGRAGGRML